MRAQELDLILLGSNIYIFGICKCQMYPSNIPLEFKVQIHPSKSGYSKSSVNRKLWYYARNMTWATCQRRTSLFVCLRRNYFLLSMLSLLVFMVSFWSSASICFVLHFLEHPYFKSIKHRVNEKKIGGRAGNDQQVFETAEAVVHSRNMRSKRKTNSHQEIYLTQGLG